MRKGARLLVGDVMEEEDVSPINWHKMLFTIIAGLIIFAVLGAIVLFIATGSLNFPSLSQSVTPAAVANGFQVNLAWGAVPQAQAYTIYRSENEGKLGVLIANVSTTKYTDIVDSEGTYYYSVKYLAGGMEYGNPVQAMVEVSRKQLPQLGQVAVTIANGANYTNSSNVTVGVQAQGATSCRFWQDNEAKSDYTAGFASYKMQLAGGDGAKTVNVECRNAESGPAETATGSAEITLDTTGPVVEIVHSTIPFNAENMTVVFSADDTFSKTLYCAPAWDGEVIGNLTEYTPNQQTQVTFTGTGSEKTYNVSIACADEAGNLAFSKALSFTTPKMNDTSPVRVSFKYQTPSVTYRDIVVVVNAQGGATQCRLRNENYSWSSWQDYSTANLGNEYSWQLSSAYGTKTVFAECRDANQSIIGIGNNSIMYAPPGSNGWYYS